jgi:hypothetical protein
LRPLTISSAIIQILFILANALCSFVFAVAYPETKGKSLEEIDEIFGDIERRDIENSSNGEKPTVERSD